MKKRVLHILSSSEYSGAENVAINIIKSLGEEYEFAYACPSGPIVDVLKNENIQHISLENSGISSLNKVLKEWRPDIIHAHDFRASIKTALSSCKYKKVSHLHQNPEWIKSINIKSMLYSLSSIRLDRVVTVSSEILEEAIFSELIQQKSSILLNSVDVESVIESANEFQYDERYDIAFVGRLVEAKNPLKYIRIIKEISKENKQVRAVMVGDGDLRFDCQDLIKELDLHKHLKMLGFLKNPFPILNNSKILVITSEWEGFGLVAVEAMALGKPVFAPPVGGLRSIINDDCGRLCHSEEEFVKSIKYCMDNKEYYNQLSNGSKENALKFSDKKNWTKTISYIYNNVLSTQ